MKMLAAIRARRAEIAKAMEVLAIEDQQLATTEQVLSRLGNSNAAAPSPGFEPGRRRATQLNQKPRFRTQREFVLEALAVSPAAWLRTADLVAYVKSRWGEVMPELSLRPLLTKLKHEGLIIRSGRLVASRERSSEAKPRSARRKG